jgi:hypothetical protein
MQALELSVLRLPRRTAPDGYVASADAWQCHRVWLEERPASRRPLKTILDLETAYDAACLSRAGHYRHSGPVASVLSITGPACWLSRNPEGGGLESAHLP